MGRCLVGQDVLRSTGDGLVDVFHVTRCICEAGHLFDGTGNEGRETLEEIPAYLLTELVIPTAVE